MFERWALMLRMMTMMMMMLLMMMIDVRWPVRSMGSPWRTLPWR